MAQTNQIFQNRVFPQVVQVRPDVFSVAIPAFKPIDLKSELYDNQSDLARMKLALQAEKERLNLEATKKRLDLAEQGVKAKRVEANKKFLKDIQTSLQIKTNGVDDMWRSKQSLDKGNYYKNAWNNLATETAKDDPLNTDNINAMAAALVEERGNDALYNSYLQMDEQMKYIHNMAKVASNNIDVNLLADLQRRYSAGEITDPMELDYNNLVVNTKYMDLYDKEISKDIKSKHMQVIANINSDGTYRTENVIISTPSRESIAKEVYADIANNNAYMTYLDHQAKSMKIIGKDLPSDMTLDQIKERLLTERVNNVTNTLSSEFAPADFTTLETSKQIEKPIPKKGSSSKGSGGSQKSYTDVSGLGGLPIGQFSPTRNFDNEVYKTRAKEALALRTIASSLPIDPNLSDTEIAQSLNAIYPNVLKILDASLMGGNTPNIITTKNYIKIGDNTLVLSKDAINRKNRFETMSGLKITDKTAINLFSFADKHNNEIYGTSTPTQPNQMTYITKKDFDRLTTQYGKNIPQKEIDRLTEKRVIKGTQTKTTTSTKKTNMSALIGGAKPRPKTK